MSNEGQNTKSARKGKGKTENTQVESTQPVQPLSVGLLPPPAPESGKYTIAAWAGYLSCRVKTLQTAIEKSGCPTHCVFQGPSGVFIDAEDLWEALRSGENKKKRTRRRKPESD